MHIYINASISICKDLGMQIPPRLHWCKGSFSSGFIPFHSPQHFAHELSPQGTSEKVLIYFYATFKLFSKCLLLMHRD